MRRLICCAVLLAASSASAETRSLPVERIEDGDTIVVLLDGEPARLQLRGIDAPEDVENAKLQRDRKVTGLTPAALLPLGHSATRHLRSLVRPGEILEVSADFERKDRYGRILAVVKTADGRSLNERMVQDGYAVVTRYGELEAALKARLERAESEAVASKRGLWGEAPEAALSWSGRKN